MQVRHAILSAAPAFLILSSGAVAQPDAPATPDNAQEAQAPAATAKPGEPEPGQRVGGTNLLPLIRVVTPGQQSTQSGPVGGYVRFYVCDLAQCGGPTAGERGNRDYGLEHRNWLSRWLVGRSFSRILTLKLTIARPNISANATLAASVQQSNRSVGETWSSEVNGRRYLTPYVRVDPDTLVGIEVSMNAATQVQANITRAVLDVVGRAAAFVQPTAQLVTALNSDRFRQTSEFIDQSVSSLFAQNLAEQSSNQFGPEDWTGKPMADITARFPMNRRIVDANNYSEVGSWRVMATAARVSMFSDVALGSPDQTQNGDYCHGVPAGDTLQACRAFVGLTPQRVLGLPVGENLTLGQALLADAAISGEVTRLVAANGADRQASARRLCGLVAAKTEFLGLNRYDAAAAVWAFAQESQLVQEKRAMVLHDSQSCGAATLLGQMKLS